MKLVDLIQTSLKKSILSQRELEATSIEKAGENLTPNMRALRLTMGVATQLLSMGASASSVAHNALGITRTYCTRPVHVDVSYTIITISQDRGSEREPLTLVRSAVMREANYQTIQRLQRLAKYIRTKHLTLAEAEKEYDHILATQKDHPNWVRHVSSGGIAAGISILYSGSAPIIALTFVIGMLISWGTNRLYKYGMSAFFVQALAALFATLMATGLTWAMNSGYIDFLPYINPTLIIISGIVLLVAGMMIVSALQDAIDEYYLTASARLLKVVMLTGGIVMGVAAGLYVAQRLDISFATTPDRLALSTTSYQYIGAALVAAMFALSNHARIVAALLAAGIGAFGYYCSLLGVAAGLGIIPSYGLAAAVIGFAATILSRVWQIPSMAIVSAGIIPLVPGLSLYNGLMHVIQNPTWTLQFDEGVSMLVRALMIAVTIAAGATFGAMIGRPMRRKALQIHNQLPFRKLSRKRPKPSETTPVIEP